MRRLFVDPASISTGWAYFVGDRCLTSGTIVADKRCSVFERLLTISRSYRGSMVSGSIDEVHIEQLPMRCHHYCHWSVGVIGAALQATGAEIKADISPSSWQKFCGWKTNRADKRHAYRLEPGSPLIEWVSKVDSDDELAAVGLGTYYVAKQKEAA